MFLGVLGEVCERFQWVCHASPDEQPLSPADRNPQFDVGQGYASVERGVHAALQPQAWSRRSCLSGNCPLCDADGNRTDLTPELTIYDDGGSTLNAEIDGIHVL